MFIEAPTRAEYHEHILTMFTTSRWLYSAPHVMLRIQFRGTVQRC